MYFVSCMPSTSVALIPVTYVCMYAGYAAMLAACTFVYLSVSLSLCLSVSLCLSLSVCTPACFRSSACLAVCVKSMQTGLQLAAGSAAGLRGQAKISVFVCIICTVCCALGEREFIARQPRRGESTSVATACFICLHISRVLHVGCMHHSLAVLLSFGLAVCRSLFAVCFSVSLALSVYLYRPCLFVCILHVCLHVCMSKCVWTGLRLATVCTQQQLPRPMKQKALRMHKDAKAPLALLDASM